MNRLVKTKSRRDSVEAYANVCRCLYALCSCSCSKSLCMCKPSNPSEHDRVMVSDANLAGARSALISGSGGSEDMQL